MSSRTLTPAGSPVALERCDRCGARPAVRVVLTSGGELIFCVHHGRAHWAALARRGADFRAVGEG